MRSTTTKYRVEYTSATWHMSPTCWLISSRDQRHADGRPTETNLRRHVEALEASTRPGGANAHLGALNIRTARLVDQDTGETIARYEVTR